MTPFHRIANAAPRAFFRYWRRSAYHIKEEQLRILRNAMAERSSRLAAEKALKLTAHRTIEKMKYDAKFQAAEITRLHNEIGKLLDAGFEVRVRRFNEHGSIIRKGEVNFATRYEVDYATNTPPVQVIRETIIQVERRRIGFKASVEDYLRWGRDENYKRHFIEMLARVVAAKIYEDMAGNAKQDAHIRFNP